MATRGNKPPVRGSRQIIYENREIIEFYRNVIIVTEIVYAILMLVFQYKHIDSHIFTLVGITTMIYMISYCMMCYLAKVTYKEDGSILDCGYDLSDPEGFAEYIKDIIILSSASQLLSMITHYFWYMLLLAPFRILYALWQTITLLVLYPM